MTQTTEPQQERKLPRSMMQTFRRKLWMEQGKLCAICKKPLDLSVKGEGVLDHDHDTGYIRGVLHRSCNAAEGKVANAAGQWGAKNTQYPAIREWLQQLLDYYAAPQQPWMYPYHLTSKEKAQRANMRRRENRAQARAKRILQARLADG